MTDKIAPRDERPGDGEAPKGWGKPPAEGSNDAPADKPKRTRSSKPKDEPASAAEVHGTQAAGVAPDVISVEDSARMTGRRGNADVAFNPATGMARVSIELHMPLGELAGVLGAMSKALGTPF